MPGQRTARVAIDADFIENRIYLIRGKKVLLDSDLAELYDVPTKALNQAVARNKRRFPSDFMFQLNGKEAGGLRSQIVTSKGVGGRRYRPYVFTEQGVAMLSSVLKSGKAIAVNIAIMRAFVQLRQVLERDKALVEKVDEIAARQQDQEERIDHVIEAIEYLANPQHVPPARRIGFPTSKTSLEAT